MRSTVTSAREDGATVVRLSGDLDLALRERASREIAGAVRAGDPVVLDLAAVRFVDSSGVAVLLQCRRSCTGAGVELRLRAVPEQPRRLFALLGLTEILRPEPGEAEAAPE
jgi:anti-anti-sigma factor